MDMRTKIISMFFLLMSGGLFSQNCNVELFEDRAVISYSSTLGKGSDAKLYYKMKGTNLWSPMQNVSGDVGLLPVTQKKYIAIWNLSQGIQASDVTEVKVVVSNTSDMEDEMVWKVISESKQEQPKVFDFVQEVATYPGGEEGMYNEMKGYIYYPELEKQNEIEGTVFVSFIVEPDGTISEIEILRGVPNGPGFDKVAIRAISKLSKRFNPAKMNGNPVRYRMRVPVKFTLN